MGERKAAADANRERILAAARKLLLQENFSAFTMEAVAREADVSRLTIYYQFDSKAGLLEALYDYLAKRGHMHRLADVFRQGNDALGFLQDFIEVFAFFWASDRDAIRRLHALGDIDPEIGAGLRARNERRRNGVKVIVDRYSRTYRQLNAIMEADAVDMLHMITSFEAFDALANGRSLEDVVRIIRKLAYSALGYLPPVVQPEPKFWSGYPEGSTTRSKHRRSRS